MSMSAAYWARQEHHNVGDYYNPRCACGEKPLWLPNDTFHDQQEDIDRHIEAEVKRAEQAEQDAKHQAWLDEQAKIIQNWEIA